VKDNFLVPPNEPFEFFLNGTAPPLSTFLLGGEDLPRAIFFGNFSTGEYLVRPDILNSEFLDEVACYAPVDNAGTFSVDQDSDYINFVYQPGDTLTCVYEYGFFLIFLESFSICF